MNEDEIQQLRDRCAGIIHGLIDGDEEHAVVYLQMLLIATAAALSGRARDVMVLSMYTLLEHEKTQHEKDARAVRH